MLFYFALISSANHRLVVLFREIRRQLDINRNLFRQAGRLIYLRFLHQTQPLSRKIALSAETQNINARTCSQG